MVGRPVKWIEDRREHLTATNHSREVDCEIEIACTRDGTMLGGARAHLRRTWAPISAPMVAWCRPRPAQFLPGPYRVRDVVDHRGSASITNKTPVGTLRAPGRFEANFFRERLLDIVARDLGLDPMEFRRKNLISEAELPFATGKLVPYEGETDFDTGDYHATFERAAKRDRLGRRRSALQGRADRRALSRPRRHAVRGKRRLRQGERAARDRGRRHP